MPFNHFKPVEATDKYVIRCVAFPVLGASDLRDLHYILRDFRDLGFRVGDRVAINAELSGYERFPSECRVYDAKGNRRHDLESPDSQSFRNHWLTSEVLWTAELRPRGVVIPGTGKHVWCSSYRHPKTQAERRKAFRLADEGEPPIRGPRLPNHLPNLWDDRVRPLNQRSWKHFRKTRWKTKGGARV